MSQIRAIAQKIKTIQSIGKVTKILQIASTVRSQELLKISKHATNFKNAFFEEFQRNYKIHHIQSNKSLVIAISTDKGMCGGVNNDVIKKTTAFIKNLPEFDVVFYCEKAKNIFTQKTKITTGVYCFTQTKEYIPVFKNIESVCQEVSNLLSKNLYKDITIIYPHSFNILSQETKIEKIYPIEVSESFEDICSKIYANSKKNYINSCVFSTISNCFVAVNYSRMLITDGATKTSQKKAHSLKLLYNNKRQSKITSELIDIISGSNAV